MCALSGQIGVPYNEAVVSNLSKETLDAMEDFFSQAELEFEQNKQAGKDRPFQPSEALRKKFKNIIEKHNGDQYCPVRQLMCIFNFYFYIY